MSHVKKKTTKKNFSSGLSCHHIPSMSRNCAFTDCCNAQWSRIAFHHDLSYFIFFFFLMGANTSHFDCVKYSPALSLTKRAWCEILMPSETGRGLVSHWAWHPGRLQSGAALCFAESFVRRTHPTPLRSHNAALSIHKFQMTAACILMVGNSLQVLFARKQVILRRKRKKMTLHLLQAYVVT